MDEWRVVDVFYKVEQSEGWEKKYILNIIIILIEDRNHSPI